MDLRALRYFLTVAETGSFSTAAALLAVSQPALSRHVQALEDEFGLPLVYRHGRGVTLTEAGQQLRQSAQEVLDGLTRMKAEMQALRESPTGHVIVGIPPMIGQFLIVPLTKSFRRKFPNISLQVIEGLSGHVHEWLSTGRVDVAIVYTAPHKAPQLLEPLLEDDLCLIGNERPAAADSETCPVAALREVPLILPSRPHGLRLMLETAAAKRSIQLNIEVEMDSLRGMIDAVQAGLGYTVLPNIAVRPLIEAERLHSWLLVDPAVTGMLALATSSQRPKTPATRYLAEAVREQVRSLVLGGQWSQRRADGPSGGSGD